MSDSVKNLTEVKMYDTYFFALFRNPINLNSLLQCVIWHVLFTSTHLFIDQLSCRCLQDSIGCLYFFLQRKWISLTFNSNNFNSMIYDTVFFSLFPIFFKTVMLKFMLLGVAKYFEITANLLHSALRTIFLLCFFFLLGPSSFLLTSLITVYLFITFLTVLVLSQPILSFNSLSLSLFWLL